MSLPDELPPTAVTKYDLKSAVKLPEREERSEWIAYNLSEFNTQVSMLYATICEHCTRDKCPEMLAGMFKYVWFTGSEDRMMNVSAPEYIEHSLDWIQEQIDDQDIFPSMSQEKEFPDNFIQVCQDIAKLLLVVFAHVIHHHMNQVKQNKDEAHMNTSLRHLIYFAKEFELITGDEIEPIREYIEKLI